MGARLAGQRPGVREIRISYGGGGFYNGGPRQFARRADPEDQIRLYQHDSELVLDLPLATEAVVPQRPQLLPPPTRKSPRLRSEECMVTEIEWSGSGSGSVSA
jgi:hypothetical protein